MGDPIPWQWLWFPKEAKPEEVNASYHDDGSASTQRVTGETVYFRAPAIHTTSVRRPPAAASEEMVEVEVEEEREVQPTNLGLVRMRWRGRVEGAQVFHVRRDCSAIRNSKMVLEIQKCSACWGRNDMDTTGEIVVADGTGWAHLAPV